MMHPHRDRGPQRGIFTQTNQLFVCISHGRVWKTPDLVWGPAPWATPSGGSRGWDPLWTGRSCRAFHPGWWGPNRPPGNWGAQTHTKKKKIDNEIKEWRLRVPWTANPKGPHINGNCTVICIIAPLISRTLENKAERWENTAQSAEHASLCVCFRFSNPLTLWWRSCPSGATTPTTCCETSATEKGRRTCVRFHRRLCVGVKPTGGSSSSSSSGVREGEASPMWYFWPHSRNS